MSARLPLSGERLFALLHIDLCEGHGIFACPCQSSQTGSLHVCSILLDADLTTGNITTNWAAGAAEWHSRAVAMGTGGGSSTTQPCPTACPLETKASASLTSTACKLPKRSLYCYCIRRFAAQRPCSPPHPLRSTRRALPPHSASRARATPASHIPAPAPVSYVQRSSNFRFARENMVSYL